MKANLAKRSYVAGVAFAALAASSFGQQPSSSVTPEVPGSATLAQAQSQIQMPEDFDRMFVKRSFAGMIVVGLSIGGVYWFRRWADENVPKRPVRRRPSGW